MSNSSVTIVEVGPRDGLQNEKRIIPTEAKIQFIDLLSESGLSVIEVTSFVSPRWVPQLADAAEVFSKIKKKPGVRYPVLVPNEKGFERALDLGVKEIAVFTAASETFTKKNINCTIEESLNNFRNIVSVARQKNIWVRGYVSTAFHCPYEGMIAPEKVLQVTEDLLAMGVEEISLGDTIGAAVPEDVEKLFVKIFPKITPKKIAVHFHDTRKTALANIRKSLEFGISIVDSSAGGLGGCPYAPGASGNVATEEVLDLMESLHIQTGVDRTIIRQASAFIDGSIT